MNKIKDFFAFAPRDPTLFNAKHGLYVFLFACLGAMTAYFLFVLSTAATIYLLLFDFAEYHLGLSWRTWLMIGKVWFVIVLLAGVFVGMSMGKYWWRIIYIERMTGKKKWR